MKKVYLMAVLLSSILIASGCKADTERATRTSVLITNFVETFDASTLHNYSYEKVANPPCIFL
ncbi:hypothetical protein [Enterococcus sp. HY326]|uniref:hypothetical protein n=1 Tax=Enterococcus sp. HY326 TaxID=2971265 RepID=UPI00223EB1A1|nr:hypothetical protein [Enterococcus sp. HY326]